MERPMGMRLSSSNALGLAIMAFACVATTGCHTHGALRRETAKVNVTLTDIYYNQVLDNIARFMHNPASMPSFCVVNAGTVNVSDTWGGSVAPNWSPTLTTASQGGGALPILSILFGASAQRNITENWSTAPVTDSDNIRRMRCAFQLVIEAGDLSECDRCRQRLEGFFLGSTETLDCMIPTRWFHVGCKRDVPKDACYVGHYCDKYVWVMPEGVDGLTRFTITVMDIATGEIHAPSRSVVKTYKGEAKPENLETTEVTSSEVDRDAIKNLSDLPMDRDRTQSGSGLNRGLFFTPR